MPRYVEVPKIALERPLLALGFQEAQQMGQVVWVKPHDRDFCLRVKVYSSIPADGGLSRSAGKDSIRVCTVFEGYQKNFGVGKFPYIARVGTVEGVVRRVLETIRLAWLRGSEWLDGRIVGRIMEQ